MDVLVHHNQMTQQEGEVYILPIRVDLSLLEYLADADDFIVVDVGILELKS